MAVAGGQNVTILEQVPDEPTLRDRLATKGLKMLEVYSESWGPCGSVVATIKKFKVEKDPDPSCLQFLQAKAENNAILQQFAHQSTPRFLFYRNGTLKETIVGPNSPGIAKVLQSLTPNNVDNDELDDNPFFVAKREAAKAEAAAGGAAAAAAQKGGPARR